ncbi:TS1R3 protein, partial [Crypturellus soui]|nr:TS1R3 protein [Crypturellus soui]
MIPQLLLCLGFARAAAPQPTCLSAQFRRAGDYIIGGLFPFGMDTTNLTARSEPTLVTCERLFADGLIWALGMKFAIEEINNSTSLLPGVKLGYDIRDTCLEPVVALQSSLPFLTQNGTTSIGALCDYTDYQPRVTAVIGPHSSDLCLVTAKLFSFFLVPQVSYGASSEKLSDKELFPSFYRTVPSDKNLVEAVVLLLIKFGWNWIATVGSNDEYGRGAQRLFSSTARNHSICIAYEGIIPTDLADPKAKSQLEETIQLINKTGVNIIVLFAFSQPAQALLEHSIRVRLGKKVWIGTEAWVLSDIATSIPNIQSIGTVLGFIMKAGPVRGFQKYVSELLSSIPQRCAPLHGVSARLRSAQVEPAYVAAYSVAHALHRALGCARGGCPGAAVRPWQLLHFMNTTPFEANGQRFRFEQARSTNTGYKLILWHWKNTTLTYLPVGDYEESLNISESKIQFHTADKKEPASECLRECEPGQVRRIKGFHLCCYDCTDCPENTFWSINESSTCTPCPEQQWAPARSTRCSDRSERYLFWDEALAVALLALMATILLLASLAAWLFTKHLETPVVQAAGGRRSLFALFALVLLALSSCLYIGKPSSELCVMQQMVCALCINACFSTLLVKSLEIALETEFPRWAPTFLPWVTQGRAWLLVALCFLTEGLFCCCYLRLGPDSLLRDYKALPAEVLLLCSTESWAAFALLHGYNICVAFVCFLCTFMVATPDDKYNAARGITFAMAIYFTIWIFFVVYFATLNTVLRPVTQICTILMLSLGILGTYYIPKCCIILFKPDLNTVDYFLSSTKERPEDDSR